MKHGGWNDCHKDKGMSRALSDQRSPRFGTYRGQGVGWWASTPGWVSSGASLALSVPYCQVTSGSLSL